MGHWGSVVGRSVGNYWGSSVVGLSLVGHIGNITVVVIGVVSDVLDPAVGKVDRVGASNDAVSVIVLLLLEGSSAVVISHGVGILVGRGLAQVISNISGLHWGVVGRGSMIGRGGVVGRGSMHGVVDWSMDSVVDWSMDSMDSVVDWSMDGMDSVVDWSVDSMVNGGVDGVVTNNSISSVKSVGSISNDSGVSSESLALGGGPVLSLVRLAH